MCEFIIGIIIICTGIFSAGMAFQYFLSNRNKKSKITVDDIIHFDDFEFSKAVQKLKKFSELYQEFKKANNERDEKRN